MFNEVDCFIDVLKVEILISLPQKIKMSNFINNNQNNENNENNKKNIIAPIIGIDLGTTYSCVAAVRYSF